ncbi:hypothetical protein [Pseudoduganella rhizocola]|uniref:hypothetical protein n=1 Tax=Pseudoduganella rhizocola TaxID=3382643 RepID=UPI0038B495CE
MYLIPMMRSAGRFPAIFMTHVGVLLASSCLAQETATPTVVQTQLPAGVTVVQATNVGRQCSPCIAKAPAPAPTAPPAVAPPPAPTPAIPAGFVVVQSNYLEQVSATAKAAIDSAKSNEESLIGIMKVCGWVLGAILAVLTFFGLKEFKAIQQVQKDLSDTLKVSNQKRKKIEEFSDKVLPGLIDSMSALREMEAIMIDVVFLQMSVAELVEPGGSEESEIRRKAEASLKRGRATLARAKALYEHRVGAKDATGLQDNVEELGRVLSYISSGVGLIAMRAGAFDEAIDAIKVSVDHNPLGYPDRRFNLACAYAKRYEATRNANDKARALELLEDDLANGVWQWEEVIEDNDLASIREDLAKSKYAPKDPKTGE